MFKIISLGLPESSNIYNYFILISSFKICLHLASKKISFGQKKNPTKKPKTKTKTKPTIFHCNSFGAETYQYQRLLTKKKK